MLFSHDNPGLATDLLLHAETGRVEASGDYLVVTTPDAPDYFFGNMLVLRQPPQPGDLVRLERDFAQRVGNEKAIAHRTFMWAYREGDMADLDGFAGYGYDAVLYRVLVAQPDEIRPVATNASVEVRAFHSQQDWDEWTRMQLADMQAASDETTQRYLSWQQAAYRRLIARGLGDWWGAFIDGEQVESLGLFFVGGIGRFQFVITSEQHRNQRVCRTLVSEVVRRTAGRCGQLVMVADEASHARHIYELLGFRACGHVGNLCRPPDGSR